MADTVSKLYAEIGFKVNQDGLKQAQKIIQDMATQMKAISNATKEAAKQYGIFSKENKKQAMADAKLATENEKAEVQRNKRMLANKKFEHKQLMDLAKLEFQVEKYNAAEKNKIERQQNREAEQASKERIKRLKNTLGGFRAFAVGLRNTFISLVGLGTAALAGGLKLTQESRQRALNVRDFQFETGVGFDDLQKYRRQFNIMGSRLSAEDIMGDLANVQQNLVDISLGKGHLSGFKLAGVRAAAGMGNSVGVIEELRKVAQTQAIDNATLINVMKDIGLKNAGQWLMNFRTVRKEDKRTQETQLNAEQITAILESEIAIRQFNEAVRNAKDQISASLAPLITDVANFFKKIVEDFSISMKNLTPETEGFRVLMESLIKVGKGFASILGQIADVYLRMLPYVKRLAEKLADKLIPTRTWEEASEIAEERQKNILEKGKEKFKGFVEGDPIDEAMAKELFGTDIANAKKMYKNLYSGDRVSQFNTDSRLNTRNVFNNNDNRVQNVTINGVAQEEIAEKAKEAVEEANKKEETIMQKKLYGASDLWVVAPTIAG